MLHITNDSDSTTINNLGNNITKYDDSDDRNDNSDHNMNDYDNDDHITDN